MIEAESESVAGSTGSTGSRIIDSLARVVSVIFHPVFLPLYGLMLIFSTPTLLVYLPGSVKRIVYLFVLVNNIILPLAILPLFRLRNIISSYRLDDRRERIVPLLTATLMYFLTAVMIFRLQLPGMIKAFSLASACVVFATALLNFRWKISVHAVGAGAMAAMVLVLSFKRYTGLVWIIAAVFILSGLIMASRMWLKAHSPWQVYAGFLNGFGVMGLAMNI